MMQEVSEPRASPVNKGSNSSGFRLKSLDIYQKIDENFKVQTSSGAALSIIGWVIIALLATAELRNYLTPRFQEHMVVDTTLGQQLRIDVNITFHALTCNEVHLDVMDVAGDNQLNVEHEMMKQRLSPHGRPVGNPGIEIIGEGPLAALPDTPPDYCGSCYGAETELKKCCNTCNELIAAYQLKQWNIGSILRNSTQCQRDRANAFNAVSPGEGCNVWGTMKVNKVSGNFHIAHGDSIVRDGKHIHHFNPVSAPTFNVSHTIHSLSFGEPYPYALPSPLDNAQHIISADENTGLFQYFIRVIPTVYSDKSLLGKSSIHTAQFTVSDRFRPLNLPKLDGSDKPAEAVLPGIFFVYDISPFMIQAERKQMSFMHLITKFCAITGGIFTMLGILDSTSFKLFRMAKK